MKPILFNTEMVRAILDGRKAVTHRVVKPQPPATACVRNRHSGTWDWAFWADTDEGHLMKPPYRPGDILYVRETWAEVETVYGVPYYVYRADDKNCLHSSRPNFSRWYPPIYMPKEAARLLLRVEDVRVERLQDITREQAHKEGQPCCLGLSTCGGPAGCTMCEAAGQNSILWLKKIQKRESAERMRQ